MTVKGPKTPRRRPVTDAELQKVTGLPVDVIAVYFVCRALMERAGGSICPDDPMIYRVLSWCAAERVQQAILTLVGRHILASGAGYLTIHRGRPRRV